MKISSDFDSGNIEVIDASDSRHVLLAIRPDLKSHHFQWFHFKVEGMTPGQRHAFSLINAGRSAYAHAWSGYNAVASYDRVDWFRVPSHFDDKGLHFALEPAHERLWFAYFEPYSRARHDGLIGEAVDRAGAEVLAIGKSVEGREIPLLRISRNATAARKVWIIAQQHPGEHMAEWYMEGVIGRLSKRDAEMEALLDRADLYLVPNMNPDGAFRGHLRTNAAGKDLNRAWQSADERETPEVFFVLQQMHKVGVDLFLDIHGDEEIPHVFTAGCEGNPGYTPRLEALENEFRQRLLNMGAEFQTKYGYPRDEPGQANTTLACDAVGMAFDCLSFTIEMPFKDHDDNPQPRTAWNGERSRRLGRDVLSVIAAMLDRLR